MASRQRAASASDSAVAEVCANALAKGNAVDAVVAGVLAAAALRPSVLLGPVQVLIGGAGAGLRAIDGRNRQPGLKVPRPRGFIDDAEVPPAARIAVPGLPAALTTALATFGTATMAKAAAAAIELAEAHSEPRAEVLRRVGRLGASALADARIADELVAVAGRVSEGLLSQADLAAIRPDVTACKLYPLPRSSGESGATRHGAFVPWGWLARGEGESEDASAVEAVAAADGRGLVAVACYAVAEEGLTIPALGLVAPFTAAPVRRGIPRTQPSELRPAAAPIALAEMDGVVDIALAVTRAPDAEALVRDVLLRVGQGLPPGLGSESKRGLLVGVVRTREVARAVLDGKDRAVDR